MPSRSPDQRPSRALSGYAGWQLRTALLALGLLPALAGATPDLEALLERARAGRATELERVTPRVTGLVLDLVGRRLRGGKELVERDLNLIRDKLDAEGAAGSLALLAFFDLSDGSASTPAFLAAPTPIPNSKTARFLALEEAARSLERVGSPAPGPGLVAAFENSGPTVRRTILRVLPRAASAQIGVPFLEGRLNDGALEVEQRALALTGLLALCPERRGAFLDGALAGQPAPIAQAALRFLIEQKDPGHDSAVDTLARDPARAPAIFDSLYLYWRAFPKTIAAPELLTWLGWIEQGQVPRELAPVVLVRLGRLPLPKRELEEALSGLAANPAPAISNAAQVLQGALGDRNARRELLDAADLVIERAKQGSWDGLLARAKLNIDLGDYSTALDDLRKVQKLSQAASPFARREVFLSQARAYALMDKYDKAADAIEAALLPNKDKQELARDPDFAGLLAHPRHGAVLATDS